MPEFLVYDQPSQVYFPRRLAKAKSAPVSGEDLKLLDEDVDAVKKVFATLAAMTRSFNGELQVIVLDHAGSEVWDGVAGVHLVEEWREGKKLVPIDWLK